MKRIVLGLLSTISVVTLLFGYHTSTSGAMSSTQVTPVTGSAQPTSAGTTQGNGASGQGGSGQAGSGGTTTVTGPTVNTRWGPVQVQLGLASGSITDVSVLQYPTGNSTDERINGYALPILVQDTLSAQGSGVHMVSGATVTSAGYLESLQGALDQAGL